VHNFLQVHAETFPVIAELGAEVFLACSCSTRSKCSLLFLRRGVRAIFYVSEVGFLAIARSCEALENDVSPTWISTTTRSHRAAAVLLPFAKKVVHGKVFSASRRTSSRGKVARRLTLGERPAGGSSGFHRKTKNTALWLPAHLVAQNDNDVSSARVPLGRCLATSFFFHVVRRCSPRSPGW